MDLFPNCRIAPITSVKKGEIVFTDLGGLQMPAFALVGESGKGTRFLVQLSKTEEGQEGPIYYLVNSWDLNVICFNESAYVAPNFKSQLVLGGVLQRYTSGSLILSEERLLICSEPSRRAGSLRGGIALVDLRTGDVLDQQIVSNIAEFSEWKMCLQLGEEKSADDLLICNWKSSPQQR